MAAAELGITLIHEHLYMDSTMMLGQHNYAPELTGTWDLQAAVECRWNPGAHPDNYRFTEADAVVEDLALFAAAGGRTVVDATPDALGRAPLKLVAIARASGLNIVMGTGHYLEATHSPELRRMTEDQIAAVIVSEVLNGVGNTGIRPGIIGEIGTDGPPTAEELRVVRGASTAAVTTGLAVSVHLHPWSAHGLAILTESFKSGIEPDRVILNHLSTAVRSGSYLDELASSGAWLAFDLFGFDHSCIGPGRYPPSDDEVAEEIARLVEQGHGARVLISQDIGVRTRLTRYGGWGYAHLVNHVSPLLASKGIPAQIIHQLLVTNPALALAGSSSACP